MFITFSVRYVNDLASVEINATFVNVSVAFEYVLLTIDQLMIEEKQRDIIRPHAGCHFHYLALVNQL